jgi:hypothetical protein
MISKKSLLVYEFEEAVGCWLFAVRTFSLLLATLMSDETFRTGEVHRFMSLKKPLAVGCSLFARFLCFWLR